MNARGWVQTCTLTRLCFLSPFCRQATSPCSGRSTPWVMPRRSSRSSQPSRCLRPSGKTRTAHVDLERGGAVKRRPLVHQPRSRERLERRPERRGESSRDWQEPRCFCNFYELLKPADCFMKNSDSRFRHTFIQWLQRNLIFKKLQSSNSSWMKDIKPSIK